MFFNRINSNLFRETMIDITEVEKILLLKKNKPDKSKRIVEKIHRLKKNLTISERREGTKGYLLFAGDAACFVKCDNRFQNFEMKCNVEYSLKLINNTSFCLERKDSKRSTITFSFEKESKRDKYLTLLWFFLRYYSGTYLSYNGNETVSIIVSKYLKKKLAELLGGDFSHPYKNLHIIMKNPHDEEDEDLEGVEGDIFYIYLNDKMNLFYGNYGNWRSSFPFFDYDELKFFWSITSKLTEALTFMKCYINKNTFFKGRKLMDCKKKIVKCSRNRKYSNFILRKILLPKINNIISNHKKILLKLKKE